MRIVDADKLLHKVKINAKRWAVIRNKTVESIIDKVLYIIEHAETVDAEPVRHGKWIRVNDEFSQCSLCKYPVYASWGESKYCPNCGCVMVGEEQ